MAQRCLAALTDFGINLALMIPLMLWYGLLPNWHILFLPVFVIAAVLAALGPALVMAALNVRYRDFRHIVPFLLQIGLYVSPVGFSDAIVPAQWRLWYALNPLVGIIDGFRWCLLAGESELYAPGLAISSVVIALLLCLGVTVFRRTEKTFADLI